MDICSKMLQYIASRIYLLSRPVDIDIESIVYTLLNYSCGIDIITELEDDTLLDILTFYIPSNLYALLNNRDIDFYHKLLVTVGKDNYKEVLKNAIIHNKTITNEFVTVINNLATLTPIDEVVASPIGKPFLGHLLRLPIGAYMYGAITDDSAKWFIDNHDPHTLFPTLLMYNMTSVSKDILQQILDLTIIHCESSVVHSTKFLQTCVMKDCDMSKCRPLLIGPYTYITALITYAVRGRKESDDILATCVTWPDDVWKCELGKAFFRFNFNKIHAMLIYTSMKNRQSTHLYKLIEDYCMEEL